MVIVAAGLRNKGAEFDHPLVVGGRMASRNAVGGFGRGGLNLAISVLAGRLHGGSASGSRGEQGWESAVAESRCPDRDRLNGRRRQVECAGVQAAREIARLKPSVASPLAATPSDSPRAVELAWWRMTARKELRH